MSSYPPSGFHFKVVLSGTRGNSDTSFKEVSGIGSEIETEDVVEGGENRYVYQLPKKVKHPKLVLKRGIAVKSSKLVEWCKDTLEGDLVKSIQTLSVHVYLLNEDGKSIRAWSFANAYPVKWEVDAFDSTKNDVAIETVELVYSYSIRLL